MEKEDNICRAIVLLRKGKMGNEKEGYIRELVFFVEEKKYGEGKGGKYLEYFCRGKEKERRKRKII